MTRLTRAQLLELLPRDKHDVAAVERLSALGYPAVEPVLPELLEWIQDINWPVARVIAPFLAGIGRPLAPQVRPVLRSSDEDWIYFTLWNVLNRNPALIDALKPELAQLAAAAPSEAGIQQCAAQLLAYGEIRE